MEPQAASSITSHIAEIEHTEQNYHDRLKELQKEVRDIYVKMDQQRVVKSSLQAFHEAHPEPKAPNPPSQNIRLLIFIQVTL